MAVTRIAIVGAGKGGSAMLRDLVKIPGIAVKYVCDVNPDAEGMVFAREQGIKTCIWDDIGSVLLDPGIDLILEVTGQSRVFRHLGRNKLASVNIMSSAASKIIFHFIDSQQQVTNELEEYKRTLETKIEQRTEEIAWANKELKHRLSDIENLNEKLQQINDAKTKYLLQATHQLKAPFAAIQSYVDVLLQGFAGGMTSQATGIIVKIKTRCQRLSQSIKNMLEMANLNSYVEENVKMQDVSLGTITQLTMASFSAVADKKKISLTYSNTAQDDVISCNHDQLTILISNILDNAITYSLENSAVSINIASSDNGGCILSIIDSGIGIPEHNISKIFQEYFRSNNAAKKHENGTGLGLAIVKRIADIHKATIEVDSILDKGTTIKVVFKKAVH